MGTKTLGSTITLTDIKECVKEKKSIELTATAGQVNLDNAEIQSYINKVGHNALPPLNDKSEIFKAIWLINPNTDSLKWDYIPQVSEAFFFRKNDFTLFVYGSK